MNLGVTLDDYEGHVRRNLDSIFDDEEDVPTRHRVTRSVDTTAMHYRASPPVILICE